MNVKSASFSTLALTAGLTLTSIVLANPQPEDDIADPEFGMPEAYQHHRGAPCPKERFAMMQQKLQLTDAQFASIKAIMDNTRQQAELIRKSIKPLRDALHQTLSAEVIDEQAVRQLSQQLANKKADLMLLRSKTHQQIKAQLTAEQAEQLEALKSQRENMRRRGPKHHRQG